MKCFARGRRSATGRRHVRPLHTNRTPRKWRPEVESMEGRALMASGLTQFAVSAGETVADLTKGPNGNFWFTENGKVDFTTTTAIGKITPSGTITLFPIPAGFGDVQSLTPLADGTVWFESFTERDPTKEPPTVDVSLHDSHIGQITPDGVVSRFDVPEGILNFNAPLVPGADGNLWFLEGNDTSNFAPPPEGTASQFHVARITPQGTIQDVSSLADIPGTSLGLDIQPNSFLKAAPNGVLWFSETGNPLGALVRIDTATGQTRAYMVPPVAGFYLSQDSLVVSTDGSVWFAEAKGLSFGRLERLSPNGEVLDVTLPHQGKVTSLKPFFGGYLTADTAGNVWFLEEARTSATYLAHVSASGDGARVAQHRAHFAQLFPGIDGSMFFIAGRQTIGHADPSGKITYTKIKAIWANAQSNYGTIFDRPKIGPDGNLWFVEPGGRFIDRYQFSDSAKTPTR